MTKFRTYELAKELYQETKRIKLYGEMKSQFERAMLSVVLNISEGSGKPTRKDRARFYFTSYASLKEVRTILDLSNNTQYITKADILSAHIYKLSQNPGGS